MGIESSSGGVEKIEIPGIRDELDELSAEFGVESLEDPVAIPKGVMSFGDMPGREIIEHKASSIESPDDFVVVQLHGEYIHEFYDSNADANDDTFLASLIDYTKLTEVKNSEGGLSYESADSTSHFGPFYAGESENPSTQVLIGLSQDETFLSLIENAVK